MEIMKLIANIQLKPTPEQESLLRQTLERCNQACNYLSARGFEVGKTRQFDLHKLAYAEVRAMYGLTAQAAVRCIAKVADVYKVGKDGQRSFRRFAAQPYDDRIVRFLSDDRVSIWTLAGREKIPFVCGARQRALLAFRKGEVDLMLVRGKWYLACVCDVPDPEEIGIEGVLGVDFGVVNIAFDSDGNSHTGADVETVRSKLARRKSGLQRRGTKAAKRRLKKLAGKEACFRKHTNHCISKVLVTEAERSRRAIGLEELTHIRRRVKARKSQRARLHSWSFAQLRAFVEYKARRVGVTVVKIDPRYTSKGCRVCGTIDDRNRPNQATFSCVSCGHAEPADLHAARNIALRARAEIVTPPLSSQAASLAA
jgi:putative transposase